MKISVNISLLLWIIYSFHEKKVVSLPDLDNNLIFKLQLWKKVENEKRNHPIRVIEKSHSPEFPEHTSEEGRKGVRKREESKKLFHATARLQASERWRTRKRNTRKSMAFPADNGDGDGELLWHVIQSDSKDRRRKDDFDCSSSDFTHRVFYGYYF